MPICHIIQPEGGKNDLFPNWQYVPEILVNNWRIQGVSSQYEYADIKGGFDILLTGAHHNIHLLEIVLGFVLTQQRIALFNKKTKQLLIVGE